MPPPDAPEMPDAPEVRELPVVPEPSEPSRPSAAPVGAGDLLRRRLVEQLAALRAAEAAAGAGHAEGVHDLRVAMRRLRSALATFRPLLDASVTEPVRDELRWAAGELGRARDAEVVLERAAARDPGRQVIAALEAEHRRHRDVVPQVLDGERYRALVESLAGLAADPPLTSRASRPARSVARQRLRHEAARFRRRVEAARAEPDPGRRAHLLHEARKAAKRVRYAAETAGPVTGRRVRRLAEAAETVQDVLGDHHDTVATRAALAALATDADAGTAFAAGRAHALEEAEAARLEEAAEDAVRRVHRRADV